MPITYILQSGLMPLVDLSLFSALVRAIELSPATITPSRSCCLLHQDPRFFETGEELPARFMTPPSVLRMSPEVHENCRLENDALSQCADRVCNHAAVAFAQHSWHPARQAHRRIWMKPPDKF